MDPKTALRNIIEAIGADVDSLEALEGILLWIKRGGHVDLSPIANAIERIGDNQDS